MLQKKLRKTKTQGRRKQNKKHTNTNDQKKKSCAQNKDEKKTLNEIKKKAREKSDSIQSLLKLLKLRLILSKQGVHSSGWKRP